MRLRSRRRRESQGDAELAVLGASIQPTGPGVPAAVEPPRGPRSARAPGRGSPPTAGVGCSSPPARPPSASGELREDRRRQVLDVGDLDVAPAPRAWTRTEWARRCARSAARRSRAPRGPWRSAAALPRWSSTAGSALRRVEPASATVAATGPRRRISSSGSGADEGRLGRAAAEAETGGEELAQRAVEGGGHGARAPRPAPRAPARLLDAAGCDPPARLCDQPPRSARAVGRY